MKLSSKYLYQILSDKTSGSSDLVAKLNNYVKVNPGNKLELEKIIELANKHLSSFQIINSYIKSLQKLLKRNDTKAIINFSESFENELKNKYSRLYKNAKIYLNKFNFILTFSNSRTIAEVFKLWKNDNPTLKVVIPESRPKNEGRLLAGKLLKINFKVDFITGLSIANFMDKIDAVIIGADKVLKNRNVINKTGSKSIAILCRYYNKPFIVLATKDKICRNNRFKQTDQNLDEIWKYRNHRLKIHNRYFELVENDLITRIFTD